MDITPEAQQKIDVLIQWIADNAVQGGDFVKDQAPDVARQIVAWGFWGGLIYGAVYLVLAVGCFVLCYLSAKKLAGWGFVMLNKSYEHDHIAMPAVLGGVIVSIVSVILGFVCASQVPASFGCAVKAAVAPKVYLLEQLRVLK